jgi:hypothetical protein
MNRAFSADYFVDHSSWGAAPGLYESAPSALMVRSTANRYQVRFVAYSSGEHAASAEGALQFQPGATPQARIATGPSAESAIHSTDV